jgi:putative RecB family exonuclease
MGSVVPQRLSPSSLDRYRECPRRFYLQDVEREAVAEGPNATLAVGNAVHRVLELAFRLHAHQRTPDNLKALLRREWRRYWPEHWSIAGEEQAKAEAAAMLEAFGEHFDVRSKPLRLEQWLTLKTEQLEVSTRVDRIDRGSYGLRLIDYKTGRRQLDESDLRHDSATLVHLLAASQQSAHPVERLSLFYLRSGEEIYWEPEPEDLELAGERLQALIGRILDDEKFAPEPGSGCQFCPFALRCDAAPSTVGLDAVLSEAINR